MNKSRHLPVLRKTVVLRAELVTKRLARITVGGPELGAFVRDGLQLPAFKSPAFDDHIKLIFAADDNISAVLPKQCERGVEWVKSRQLITRNYTVRRFDAQKLELDLEFVLHGTGPAATWAAAAKPGDELYFVGPKSSAVLPENPQQIVILGDETSLPAVARYFSERPLNSPVKAVLVVENEEAIFELDTKAQDSLQWVTADSDTAQQYNEIIRELAPADKDYTDGSVYFFAAAESKALLPVRRYLKRELSVPKNCMNITGYWHNKEKKKAKHAKAVRTENICLPASPNAWLITRTALETGIIDALAGQIKSVQQLAQELSLEPTGLKLLVAALCEIGVLETTNDLVQLGVAGQLLIDDEQAAETFSGFHAEKTLTLLNLAKQLRGREISAWFVENKQTLRQSALENTQIYADLIAQAEIMQFVAQKLASANRWLGYKNIAVYGPGSVAFAKILAKSKLKLQLDVIEEKSVLPNIKAELAECDLGNLQLQLQSFVSDTQAIVCALTTHSLEAGEVARHISNLAKYTAELLLVVAENADSQVPSAAQDDLMRYSLIGRAQTNFAEIFELAKSAGFRVGSRTILGRSLAVYEFRK